MGDGSRIAFVTCSELPEIVADDELVRHPLAGLGLSLEAAGWDDAGVDWRRYDLAVLRSPWNYTRRRADFVAWAHTVPRLANPAGIVEWNTDKVYLAELARAGVPVVPTDWVGPTDVWTLPDAGEWVIKPAVSAGSVDTGRYDAALPEHRQLAAAHMARLQAAGRLAMVQPYLAAVDTAGETALLYLGGTYSHAIRKGALLHGPDTGVEGMFRLEKIMAREPTAAQRELADRALAAIPGRPDLLYARIDVIPGPDGSDLLVELELTEPSLFLEYSPTAPDRLAAAIAAAVS